MSKTLLVFALLAVIAFAGYQKSPFQKKFSHQETLVSLAEMDKEAFGQTVISLVAMNAAVKNPWEEISLALDQIKSEIVADQEQADESNRTDQAYCDSTINGLVTQIGEHQAEIAKLTADIKSNEELLAQAKIDLAQAQNDYDETVEAIETGTAQREAEHAKWAEEDYQQSISIATLEEGVKLINHMIHGVAFSQIKTRYDKVLEKLKDNENKHASLFKPLITTLTQLATKMNYENVMKILELLKNIRQGIVDEQEKARSAEEKSQQDWEALLAQLTAQKQFLADKISRLTTLIQNTEELLVQLKESLSNHQEGLANCQDALAAVKAECSEKALKYLSETAERDREQEIIEKVSQHMAERLGAVSDYLADRG